jgi:phosphomethylpyrimidine synthase
LSRRSFSEDGSLGEGGCSLRITEDVRRYAVEHGMTEEEAIKQGLEQKATEFVEKGSEVYAKA